MACSPICLIGLMDRALRPVIAKGRVQFSANPETFHVPFFNPCSFYCNDHVHFHNCFIYVKVLFKEIQIDSIIKK